MWIQLQAKSNDIFQNTYPHIPTIERKFNLTTSKTSWETINRRENKSDQYSLVTTMTVKILPRSWAHHLWSSLWMEMITMYVRFADTHFTKLMLEPTSQPNVFWFENVNVDSSTHLTTIGNHRHCTILQLTILLDSLIQFKNRIDCADLDYKITLYLLVNFPLFIT